MIPVPRLWPGETIVCVGAGPSLTREDVAACYGHTRMIVINDAFRYAPWADVIFGPDAKWWGWHQAVPDDLLPPLKYTLQREALAHRPSLSVLNYSGETEIETRRTDTVRHGGLGGYAAINLAVHLVGPQSRILLLGYDMQSQRRPDGTEQHHFFGEHPDRNHPKYAYRMGAFHSLLAPLAQLGISIVNCSRETALPYIPRQPLADVLAASTAAVTVH